MVGPLAQTPGPHSQQPPGAGRLVVDVDVVVDVEVLVVLVVLVDVVVVEEVDVLEVLDTVTVEVEVLVVLVALVDVVVGALHAIWTRRSAASARTSAVSSLESW